MALGGIRYTAISEWARRNGVRDFARFAALIQHMDSVYLAHTNPKKGEK